MLDNETRKLLMAALDEDQNVKRVAESFSVDVSTVYRLLKQRKKTGSVETRTHLRGRKSVLSEEDIRKICELVEKQPDIKLQEIIDTLELHVCVETVRKAVVKMGYTYKKVLFRAGEQGKRIEPGYIWVRKEPGR